MLIRCARCHAVFSVQDGLARPVQRAFQVECGRCEAVFDAQSGQLPEVPRTSLPRVIPTPVPFQRPAAVGALPAPSLAVERHAAADQATDTAPLRPAISGAFARRGPSIGGAVAVAVLAGAVVVAALLVVRSRGPRAADAKAEQAMQALLLDDDESLEQSAALFGEAARLEADDPRFEADRAFAMLLRGSAQRDVAERLEALAKADPAVAAEREARLREGARLVREGVAAAEAAAARAPDEVAALRAMALAAALTRGNPQRWLEAAQRKAPDDALVAYARAAAAAAGGSVTEVQDRALAVARDAEPRLLRARVDEGALSLERRDLAAARQALQGVIEANPRHERAKRLLSLLQR